MNQISFAKLETGMDMPHLLDIQTRAFESLLQLDAAQQEREDVGLERVFKDLFPITDVHENFSLEFVRYSLGEPKYTVAECIERDMTYSAPLKATLQLVIFEDTGDGKRPRNIIEKEVYLGELPLLTELGTFVINGAERVIVSPAAPVARRGVRGVDAPQRAAPALVADHPVPRLVGRVHRGHPRRDLRPHRQEEEVPGHGAAARVRLRREPRHPAPVLRRARPRPHHEARDAQRAARNPRRDHRRGHHARGRSHRRRRAEAEDQEGQGRARARRSGAARARGRRAHRRGAQPPRAPGHRHGQGVRVVHADRPARRTGRDRPRRARGAPHPGARRRRPGDGRGSRREGHRRSPTPSSRRSARPTSPRSTCSWPRAAPSRR